MEYRDMFGPGMEHYEGNGIFDRVARSEAAGGGFQKKFEHPLPISAEGETDLHRALGFDHTGRVDVADKSERSGRGLVAPLSQVAANSLLRIYPRDSRQSHCRAHPYRHRKHTLA